MKKFFLVAVMCVMAMTAMGQQIKSIEAKANLRGDFGIGAGFTMQIWDYIDFSPNFNYYFTDDSMGDVFTLDADFHYNFEMDQNWTLYPMVGLAWFHASAKLGDDYNKIGANLGGGARYQINRNWAAFAEAKYQWVTDFDDSFFTLGMSYCF